MAATRYPYPLISFIVLAGGCNPAPDPLPNPLDGCGWSEAETEGALGLAESPEFQSYMEDHVIELDEGGWVAEGDIIIDDFNTLLSHYQRAAMPTEQNGSDSGFRSTASCGGFLSDHLIDAIWNPAAKLAITYCFDASWDDVPDYRDIAEEGLANATLRWETAADVNFIQLPSGSSCSHENGVVYEIQYVPSDFGSGFYALTSFPDEDEHTLQLFTRAFGEDAFVPLDYLFTHELGHSLGLYHEHARFAQGNLQCLWTAGAPSFWRGLTAADPDSVMGYPQCVGPSPMPPHPSALDRTGLGFLYNLSRPILSGPMGLDSGVLVWHRPSTSDYVVWQPVGGGNQPLAFSETEGCYEPGCETLESSEYWKPLLYRNDSSVDVFMYGPAHYEERRLMGERATEVPRLAGLRATQARELRTAGHLMVHPCVELTEAQLSPSRERRHRAADHLISHSLSILRALPKPQPIHGHLHCDTREQQPKQSSALTIPPSKMPTASATRTATPQATQNMDNGSPPTRPLSMEGTRTRRGPPRRRPRG
jgi:hypothetical protein